VTFSLPDWQIRIFSFLSGKISRKYDESLTTIQEMQQAGTTIYKVDDMEFSRRLAVERELELPGPDGKIPGMWMNAIWDESRSFIIYPTLLGIKGQCYFKGELSRLKLMGIPVVNTIINKVARLLGKDETIRWMNLAIYQGQPAKKSLTMVSIVGDLSVLFELTWCIVGDGGLRQPPVSGKVSEGSDTVLHRVQETAIPYVHTLRTRVSFIWPIGLNTLFI
jgi:peptidylprolyl isomerase domain and WD repeat-containing protein 1